MKKIIAAALSILVGAFGYTIVDKALENRVANLESEIVELKEEVSRYHPQPISADTSKVPLLTGSTYRPTTSSRHTEPTTPGLYPGKYIDKSSDSKSKFLLRLYDDGDLVYLKPENYQEDMTRIYYNDYFLYLTESSAQITAVDSKEEYSYKYDDDYSLISCPYIRSLVTIKFNYKGYTDPALAGRRIDFSVKVFNSYGFWTHLGENNIINPDGSFEFSETVVLDKDESKLISQSCVYVVSDLNLT